jgi:hypothetical protein
VDRRVLLWYVSDGYTPCLPAADQPVYINKKGLQWNTSDGYTPCSIAAADQLAYIELSNAFIPFLPQEIKKIMNNKKIIYSADRIDARYEKKEGRSHV